MICSFGCADTEALFHSRAVSRFRKIERVARRKLLQIHAAKQLASLRIPPGNQLDAADIDVSPSRISELVNGQRPVTADTALRLGMFFGMAPRFWLNLQSEYDLRVADRALRTTLARRIRVRQPAEA